MSNCEYLNPILSLTINHVERKSVEANTPNIRIPLDPITMRSLYDAFHSRFK
jgi:hypothetical protein